jgi:molybdopterin-guanine dinucleotide biosynthesis protein A
LITTKTGKPQKFAICILAGGLSARMGRDKSRMRLGRKSMLEIITQTARKTGLPVRVIRRDIVPRCGPLGGVLTGLQKSCAQSILFLACDMPFITADLLTKLIKKGAGATSLFVRTDKGAGFPFILRTDAREIVLKQIADRDLSLQRLARALKAKLWGLPVSLASQVQNVNTPEQYKLAREAWIESVPKTNR